MQMHRTFKLFVGRLLNRKTKILHGVKIVTDPENVPHQVRNLLFKETYEQAECELVKRYLSKNDRVLEIGTGIGLVSLVATKIVGQGLVKSFEANPAMESLIRKNFQLNDLEPNLEMRAVTKDGEDVCFYQDPQILSSSAFDRGVTTTKISVPSTSIKQAIDEWQPNILIMDVEGSEIELINGANLAEIHIVIMELHSFIVGHEKTDAMLAFLESSGFIQLDENDKTVVLRRRSGG
jgi:FkbM family methyltransferase